MDVFHKAKRSLLEDEVFHKENGKLPYVYLEDLKSKLKTWRASSGLLYKEGCAL